MKPRAPARLGLFARIYFFGLLLLVAMAAAVAAFLRFAVDPLQDAETLRIARFVLDEAELRSSTIERRGFLQRLSDDANIQVTFHGADGAVLESIRSSEVEPLSRQTMQQIAAHGHAFIDGAQTVALGVFQNGALQRIGVVDSRSDVNVELGVGALLGIITGLAVLAWPMARTLSIPIRRLSETVMRFGAGDMEVRSRLRRRDEIGALARTFNEMADRIVALLRAEKLLIAGVAHELRTPLQRIRIATELACEDDAQADPLPRQHFEAMLGDLRDLEQIITDVLTLARLETTRAGASGELMKQRESTPAELFLRECALKFEMREPSRQLSVELAASLPEVCIERRLVAMAVSNLLDNADRYSPPDAAIELKARATATHLVIWVADQGVGIAPEHHAEVFRPFYRTDAARTRCAGGAGLGLAIVKGVIEAHGGTIVVDSEEGRGACFTLKLPLAK